MFTKNSIESVSGALGGAMRGIEGVLLPKDRHGDVDLRGNADTFIWVSDLGPETDTEGQYGERLLAALSTHGEVPVVGGCFSSIRVKSGQPSQVQVVSIEENPPSWKRFCIVTIRVRSEKSVMQ